MQISRFTLTLDYDTAEGSSAAKQTIRIDGHAVSREELAASVAKLIDRQLALLCDDAAQAEQLAKRDAEIEKLGKKLALIEEATAAAKAAKKAEPVPMKIQAEPEEQPRRSRSSRS